MQVVAVYPHDTSAFTQGLLWDHGHLYESTGLEGESTLREVELTSGKVLRRAELPAAWFGEGLARVGDELVQLTWHDGVALRWDRARFARIGEWRYLGEGWGLTSDGHELVMSDGSSWLTFRDPATFATRRRVQVVDERGPLGYVNELEWVDGAVWANVWQSDAIVRIDPVSGRVTGRVDASGLLSPEEREATDVLNGLAWDPEQRLFYVTGKLWPKLFAVRFAPERSD
jgi:glutaminyl-peptide cyclotransferase